MGSMFGERQCIKQRLNVRGESSLPFWLELVLIIRSLDYLFQLAVEMKKLGISWLSDIP
jgi:hypothetical protein